MNVSEKNFVLILFKALRKTMFVVPSMSICILLQIKVICNVKEASENNIFDL